MALRPTSLTTLTRFKDWMGITSGLEDSRLELMIDAASEMICRYCDRWFVQDTYTELMSGRRGSYLLPRQWPVTAITELRSSTSRNWSDPTSLISSALYSIGDDNQSVVFDYYHIGYGDLRMIYTAGYTASTLPAEIELACVQLAEWIYMSRTRRDSGKTSSSKGDESYGIVDGIPPHIITLLEPHVRLEVPDTSFRGYEPS